MPGQGLLWKQRVWRDWHWSWQQGGWLVEEGLHPWKPACTECREPTWMLSYLTQSEGEQKKKKRIPWLCQQHSFPLIFSVSCSEIIFCSLHGYAKGKIVNSNKIRWQDTWAFTKKHYFTRLNVYTIHCRPRQFSLLIYCTGRLCSAIKIPFVAPPYPCKKHYYMSRHQDNITRNRGVFH